MFKPQLPSRTELVCLIVFWTFYFVVASTFVGLRPDNFLLAVLYIVLFSYNRYTRAFTYAMTPFALFGLSYDWMRIWPNYMVNSVDVQGINDLERALFGIGGLTPNEFFAQFDIPALDFLAGLFYLCWVPVPMAFGLYLFFRGKHEDFAHFAWAFLFVNIIGFIGYYIHPAAPPWYVRDYGFDVILGTPGNAAGLVGFDNIVGMKIFQSIYGENANVFAAVPSLHAAYMLITTVYAVRSRSPRLLCLLFAVITLGIWWTAVYTFHHYVIDVLLGILTAVIGITLLEWLARHTAPVKGFFRSYMERIRVKG